ncbi:MAG TPA: hypothetical protein VLP30_04800, partial [Desulfatirhabdiaceae bacterium]|nr:hypothetical protein [Desulfatirhabdiaceae bacterium]
MGALSVGDGQKRPIPSLLPSQNHYLKSYITLFLMMSVFISDSPAADSKDIILSTTTSTVDSGLLDVLVPMFEKKT